MRKLVQIVGTTFFTLLVVTALSIKRPPEKLRDIVVSTQKSLVLDKNFTHLLKTYKGRWNEHQLIPLQEIPPLIQNAFITAEDKRFFAHNGIDWLARLSAIVSNIKAMKVVRGASTITEQVARMVTPRPRNIWSRWIEGLEATWIEFRFSKEKILEFYLNQVPFTANRRGIVQAASYYFDRDLHTLSTAESLALAALLRSPSRLDLYKNPKKIVRPLQNIARKLNIQIKLNELDFNLRKPRLETKAPHFINYVNQNNVHNLPRVATTLNPELQNQVQKLIDKRMKDLYSYNVKNGAVLVVDFQKGQILSWVNAGNKTDDIRSGHIDAILSPRQPGSTLKPFLYALAIQDGYTAATIITDSPFETPVGTGVHIIKNYSRRYYGPLTLRQCLANSLNIPAIKTVKYVGINSFFGLMKDLGFRGLTRNVEYYGEGLVLGNAEVTLLELVQAYGVLANRGKQRNFTFSEDIMIGGKEKRIFPPEVTSIIGNILSDNNARSLEFGNGGILDFPYQTAIKTGTSTDYRDSWTVAYNDKFIVGSWMGNLDGMPTDGLTGSTGPALLVRSIFALLNSHRKVNPLFLSKKLIKKNICRKLDHLKECFSQDEYFISGTEPKESINKIKKEKKKFHILSPHNDLKMALDPRVPNNLRSFEFQATAISGKKRVKWILNGDLLKNNGHSSLIWNLKKGEHTLVAELYLRNNKIAQDKVRFIVRD